MKTVFTNAMVAHVWAQLKQPRGRSGSMRFDGAVGYSYATPVAHIIEPKGHAPIVLIRGNDWGPATNKHLHLYRNASSQYRQFEVPHVVWSAYDDADCHATNIKHLTKCYTDERDALLRVPCDSWRVEGMRALETLERLAANLSDYQKAFDLNVQRPTALQDAAAATARRDRLANDPKRAAKRAKAAAAREAAEARKQAAWVIENAAALAEWRAGERDYLDRDLPVALRIKGDVVQTSLGAEVPLEHAKRALEFYRLMVANKRLPWTRNERATLLGATTVGHFTLDAIDERGELRAGCHVISAAELERFGKLLAVQS